MKYYEDIQLLRCDAEEVKDAIEFMVNNEVKECCVDWHNYKANNEYMPDEWGLDTNPKYKALNKEWYKLSHLDDRFRFDVEFNFWC